jgi:hypothetical protein
MAEKFKTKKIAKETITGLKLELNSFDPAVGAGHLEYTVRVSFAVKEHDEAKLTFRGSIALGHEALVLYSTDARPSYSYNRFREYSFAAKSEPLFCEIEARYIEAWKTAMLRGGSAVETFVASFPGETQINNSDAYDRANQVSRQQIALKLKTLADYAAERTEEEKNSIN